MNVERLKKLADHIEQLPEKAFNMSTYWCGTAGCIAGWTVNYFHGWSAEQLEAAGRDLADMAASELGLDRDQAEELFYGIGAEFEVLSDITADEAVATIRHLIKTGEVKWTR